MSESSTAVPPYRLSSGGLIYRLMLRLRVVEEHKYHLDRQIVVALALAWLPLVVLSAIEGTLAGGSMGRSFLHDMVPNVRFLVALPLLVIADAFIDPLTNGVVQHVGSSGLLRDADRPQYDAALNELTQRRDSVWADVVIIALAIAFTWLFKSGYEESGLDATSASSWLMMVSGQDQRLTFAGWWYMLVSAPLFMVFLFRWLWRFLIWAGFLYRISRTPLALQPAHPDLAGGLAPLSTGQNAFVIVFVAFAAVLSATLGHDILFEGHTLSEIRPSVIGFVLSSVALLYAPLLFFLRKLERARVKGRREYNALGYRLSNAFHNKWIKKAPLAQGYDLMGSVDSSAMADYTATYDVVRSMRVIPATLRGTAVLIGVLALPFLPLYLTQFSITEALERLAGALV